MGAPGARADRTGTSTATYQVDGMSCEHCVAAVREELLALDGVRAVDVELAAQGASRVSVSSVRPLARSVVSKAVDEAGYRLVVET
jgi:copper chaperone